MLPISDSALRGALVGAVVTSCFFILFLALSESGVPASLPVSSSSNVPHQGQRDSQPSVTTGAVQPRLADPTRTHSPKKVSAERVTLGKATGSRNSLGFEPTVLSFPEDELTQRYDPIWTSFVVNVETLMDHALSSYETMTRTPAIGEVIAPQHVDIDSLSLFSNLGPLDGDLFHLTGSILLFRMVGISIPANPLQRPATPLAYAPTFSRRPFSLAAGPRMSDPSPVTSDTSEIIEAGASQGMGSEPKMESRGMTPLPEPGSAALLLIGAWATLVRRRNCGS